MTYLIVSYTCQSVYDVIGTDAGYKMAVLTVMFSRLSNVDLKKKKKKTGNRAETNAGVCFLSIPIGKSHEASLVRFSFKFFTYALAEGKEKRRRRGDEVAERLSRRQLLPSVSHRRESGFHHQGRTLAHG